MRFYKWLAQFFVIAPPPMPARPTTLRRPRSLDTRMSRFHDAEARLISRAQNRHENLQRLRKINTD